MASADTTFNLIERDNLIEYFKSHIEIENEADKKRCIENAENLVFTESFQTSNEIKE